MAARVRLEGRVCVVTGASRGIGKGIAMALCGAGATVYITGRSLGKGKGIRSLGSLQATAEEAQARGGRCIPVVCDHSNDQSTEALFERIKAEQGKLHCLVNNAFAAADSVPQGIKFYEKPLHIWDDVHNVGLRSHYVASVFAARLMTVQDSGDEPKCIINISSAGGFKYLFDIAYGVGKAAVDRLAADMAVELKDEGVACLSLWPGAVKTEYLASQGFKVGGRQMPMEIMETPEFTGLAVVALLSHPEDLMQKSGDILQCSEVAQEYDYTDVEGNKVPNLIPPKAIDKGLANFRSSRL